jgi:hypothetical protein
MANLPLIDPAELAKQREALEKLMKENILPALEIQWKNHERDLKTSLKAGAGDSAEFAIAAKELQGIVSSFAKGSFEDRKRELQRLKDFQKDLASYQLSHEEKAKILQSMEETNKIIKSSFSREAKAAAAAAGKTRIRDKIVSGLGGSIGARIASADSRMPKFMELGLDFLGKGFKKAIDSRRELKDLAASAAALEMRNLSERINNAVDAAALAAENAKKAAEAANQTAQAEAAAGGGKAAEGASSSASSSPAAPAGAADPANASALASLQATLNSFMGESGRAAAANDLGWRMLSDEMEKTLAAPEGGKNSAVFEALAGEIKKEAEALSKMANEERRKHKGVLAEYQKMVDAANLSAGEQERLSGALKSAGIQLEKSFKLGARAAEAWKKFNPLKNADQFGSALEKVDSRMPKIMSMGFNFGGKLLKGVFGKSEEEKEKSEEAGKNSMFAIYGMIKKLSAPAGKEEEEGEGEGGGGKEKKGEKKAGAGSSAAPSPAGPPSAPAAPAAGAAASTAPAPVSPAAAAPGGKKTVFQRVKQAVVKVSNFKEMGGHFKALGALIGKGFKGLASKGFSLIGGLLKGFLLAKFIGPLLAMAGPLMGLLAGAAPLMAVIAAFAASAGIGLLIGTVIEKFLGRHIADVMGYGVDAVKRKRAEGRKAAGQSAQGFAAQSAEGKGAKSRGVGAVAGDNAIKTTMEDALISPSGPFGQGKFNSMSDGEWKKWRAGMERSNIFYTGNFDLFEFDGKSGIDALDTLEGRQAFSKWIVSNFNGQNIDLSADQIDEQLKEMAQRRGRMNDSEFWHEVSGYDAGPNKMSEHEYAQYQSARAENKQRAELAKRTGLVFYDAETGRQIISGNRSYTTEEVESIPDTIKTPHSSGGFAIYVDRSKFDGGALLEDQKKAFVPLDEIGAQIIDASTGMTAQERDDRNAADAEYRSSLRPLQIPGPEPSIELLDDRGAGIDALSAAAGENAEAAAASQAPQAPVILNSSPTNVVSGGGGDGGSHFIPMPYGGNDTRNLAAGFGASLS